MGPSRGPRECTQAGARLPQSRDHQAWHALCSQWGSVTRVPCAVEGWVLWGDRQAALELGTAPPTHHREADMPLEKLCPAVQGHRTQLTGWPGLS